MRRVRILTALIGGVVLLSAAIPASATHGSFYHWARSSNPATLTVVDSLAGDWDSLLGPVVADWHSSSVIDLTTEPGADSYLDRLQCNPILGKIRVCNAHYPDPMWLGLATSYIQDGHVIQATAQVNDLLFDTPLYGNPNTERHVLCQEIGHTFGLSHTYTEPTCMDDKNGLTNPAYNSPGPHDFAQLEAT